MVQTCKKLSSSTEAIVKSSLGFQENSLIMAKCPSCLKQGWSQFFKFQMEILLSSPVVANKFAAKGAHLAEVTPKAHCKLIKGE